MGRRKGCQMSKKTEMNLECQKLFRISSAISTSNQLWKSHLEISDILNKIQNLEGKRFNSLKRIDAIENFVIWMKENGAKIDGVSIYEFPEYNLGLKAEIDFNEDELILEIPRTLIFNVQTAAPELKEIQDDAMIRHMPQVALAIALLIEKYKNDSKWKPYINILPKDYCTVLYMTVDDLNELKGSPTLETALKQCRNIARQYAYFYNLFQNTTNAVSNILKDVFTYEEYRWAVSTIMTRQNIIPSENNLSAYHSLIPMWDMCNHEEGKITTNYNEQTNSCQCFAMRNFQSGDQVFIFYGPRTNSEFFIHSGFVYPNNKNDSFQLRMGISKEDPLQNERVNLLSKIGLPAVSEYLLKPEPNPVSGLLLGFIRIFHLNKNQLNHWLLSSKVDDITLKNKSFFDENFDKNVINFIVTRIKLLLNNYPLSEQDIIQLLSTTSHKCKKLVLQMRLSEKKLLSSVLENIENLLVNS